MKFFIINSFRFLVYIAYFGIIALYAFGAYIERAQIQEVILGLSHAGKPAGPFGIDAEENAFPCLGRFEGLQLSLPDKGFVVAHVDVPR